MKNIFSKSPVSKAIAVGLLSSVFLLPLSARAEIKKGSIEISPFAGFNVFQNDQNLKDRFIYGGRIGYNITPNWGIEGSMEFVNTHVNHKSRTGAKEGQFRNPTTDVDLFFYHLDALYHFMPESKFNPYLVAGLGGVHYSPRISTQDMTAISFGAGAKYWVADNVALRIDIRDNVVSEIFQEAYHNLNATAGIVFAFGGTSNLQPVKAVAAPDCPTCVPCPVPVKAIDTTPPYVTLATPYNDSTDSPLHKKMHIAFSESIDPSTINGNTFTLYQGKTAVPGSVRTPTNQAASFTPKNDLTPDTEYTGKVTTGVKDLAGNSLEKNYVWSFKTAPTPDPTVITKVKTETKVVVVNKFVMLTGAHFAFDSAALTPEGKKLILQNIKIMKDNSDIKVRIVGHSSAAGSEKYNQSLSERRAKSVSDFVISEGGIAPERLEVIGYGETRPIMKEVNPNDHGSKAAKANMRVVFEIKDK